eukprot:3009854-Rhodomonas_salina.2
MTATHLELTPQAVLPGAGAGTRADPTAADRIGGMAGPGRDEREEGGALSLRAAEADGQVRETQGLLAARLRPLLPCVRS